MPAAQVEPDDGDEAFERIVDFGHGQQRLRVRHEATTTPHRVSMSSSPGIVGLGLHALCNPFQHRSRLEDEGGQHDPAQVGSGTELRDDVGEDWRSHRKKSASTQLETFPRLIRGRTLREEQGQRKQHSPLPCSGSTTVSSSGPGESGRDSSAEERLPVLWKTREVQLSAPMAAVAAGRGGMSVFGEEGTMAGSGDGHDGEKFPGELTV